MYQFQNTSPNEDSGEFRKRTKIYCMYALIYQVNKRNYKSENIPHHLFP